MKSGVLPKGSLGSRRVRRTTRSEKTILLLYFFKKQKIFLLILQEANRFSPWKGRAEKTPFSSPVKMIALLLKAFYN